MNKIFCIICKQDKEIVEFERDDPKLSCGHVKSISSEDEEQLNTPKEQVKNLMNLFEPTSTAGHCDICGVVTIIKDSNGVLRCGGNLHTNPGCGMPLKLYNRQKQAK